MEFRIRKRSDRVYCAWYNRDQVDLFYDLAEYVHDIMFNEQHVYPSSTVNLFGNPEIETDLLTPDTNMDRPAMYIYKIRYGVAGRSVDPDDIPFAAVVVQLVCPLVDNRREISQRCVVNVGEWCEYVMDGWSFNITNRMHDNIMTNPKTENKTDQIKDLVRHWILIPRSTKEIDEMRVIYRNLERIYYERLDYLHNQFPAFALAIDPRFRGISMNPWVAEGLTLDMIDLIRRVGLPEYPPSVP